MQRLFSLFERMGYADLYYRQGSLSDEEYPSSFFTFWNIDTLYDSFYDDNEVRHNEYVQVGFYTNDANLVYSEMDRFVEEAKKAGFVISGKPRDADADKKGYLGRVCYIRIINKV